MTLNAKKCELISDNSEDKIIDSKEQITLTTIPQAKYLGQAINCQGEPVNPITTNNIQQISAIINNTNSMLTRRGRIKIYTIYIKSKYQHLIPLIATSDK